MKYCIRLSNREWQITLHHCDLVMTNNSTPYGRKRPFTRQKCKTEDLTQLYLPRLLKRGVVLLVTLLFWNIFSITNFQGYNWSMEFRNENFSKHQFIWIWWILESASVSRRFKFLHGIKITKEIKIFIEILFLCRKWFKLSFINFGSRCEQRWANSGLAQTKKFCLTKIQTNFFLVWYLVWWSGIWSGGLANYYFLI